MSFVETAYAKINVALHVRGRRADGYHDLETLFAFAEDGDTLAVDPADELTLAVDGPFADALPPGSDNLVMQAADALRARHGGTMGARLRLTKRLPVASGIGGGSADAAAALRLLGRLWGTEADEALAADLGADVPACLSSCSAWADGRGYPLRPLAPDPLGGAPLLLVNPGVPLSTRAMFAAWDGIDRGGLADTAEAAFDGRNDLEAPAIAAAPEIGQLLVTMRGLPGARLVRMSGSGATCFALFVDETTRDLGAATMAAAFPQAWQLATRLRGVRDAGASEETR